MRLDEHLREFAGPPIDECTCEEPTTEEEIEDHGASPDTVPAARVVYCTDCNGLVERERL